MSETTTGIAPAAFGTVAFRRIFIGLMLALTLASLDGNIVGPALPRIVSDLGGLAHLSWVVTAFAVASTAATPLYGKLSDQFGRRPAFFVSIGVFLFGSVLCGLARSMAAMIAFRALQGVGAGGLMTLSQTVLADLVPPRERGRYQGWITAVFALCSVAGPLLGGVITDALSWPWIFFINLPVGAAAIAIIGTTLREPVRNRGRAVDLPGFALLIGSTITGLLALSWGGTRFAWTSAPILVLGAMTAAMLAVLTVVERRAAEPALPPRLLANRLFARAAGGITLALMALFAAITFIPLYFQLVLGTSATEAGLRMAPLMGGIVISSILGGRLVTRTGRYKIFPVIGLGIVTLAYALLAVEVHRATASPWAIDALLTLLGLGSGLVMPTLTIAIQNAVPIADLGVATATQAFFRGLGGAFGVAAAGMVLTRALGTGAGPLLSRGLDGLRALPASQAAPLLGSFRGAMAGIFGMAAAIAALGFLVIIGMREVPLRR